MTIHLNYLPFLAAGSNLYKWSMKPDRGDQGVATTGAGATSTEQTLPPSYMCMSSGEFLHLQTSYDAEKADLPMNRRPSGATQYALRGTKWKMSCGGASTGDVLKGDEGALPPEGFPCQSGDRVSERGLDPDGGNGMGSGEEGLGGAATLSMAPEGSSPPTTDAVLCTGEGSLDVPVVPVCGVDAAVPVEEQQYKLPPQLDNTAYIIHMAAFGILGVIARYLLQRLFGATVRAFLSNGTPPYISLPPNMIGSFFMGWFGLVFKGNISHFSDHLAVGLVAGFLGSLSTFCGWTQRMLELSSHGHWVYAMAGILLGWFLVNESFRLGVESAVSLRRCMFGTGEEVQERFVLKLERQTLMNRPKRCVAAVMTAVMLLIWGLLWGLSGAFARTKLDSVSDGAMPWLACLVGPPGVWLRWYLARLNGKGLGRNGSLKWLPLGTLTANVSAACTMAALATLKKAVPTRKCAIVVTGVQYGFLGCLSSITTFVAEVDAMRQNGHLGRALAYTAATLIPSFGLGTLIYSLPVWTRHYS